MTAKLPELPELGDLIHIAYEDGREGREDWSPELAVAQSDLIDAIRAYAEEAVRLAVGHHVGYLNVRSRHFYKLSEWAETPRNELLVSEGRVHKGYCGADLDAAWLECLNSEAAQG